MWGWLSGLASLLTGSYAGTYLHSGYARAPEQELVSKLKYEEELPVDFYYNVPQDLPGLRDQDVGAGEAIAGLRKRFYYMEIPWM